MSSPSPFAYISSPASIQTQGRSINANWIISPECSGGDGKRESRLRARRRTLERKYQRQFNPHTGRPISLTDASKPLVNDEGTIPYNQWISRASLTSIISIAPFCLRILSISELPPVDTLRSGMEHVTRCDYDPLILDFSYR